jgi:hypothetical protein
MNARRLHLAPGKNFGDKIRTQALRMARNAAKRLEEPHGDTVFALQPAINNDISKQVACKRVQDPHQDKG